jgi:hypothetical protein
MWKRSARENPQTLLHIDFITVQSLLQCNNSLPGNIIRPPQSKLNKKNITTRRLHNLISIKSIPEIQVKS